MVEYVLISPLHLCLSVYLLSLIEGFYMLCLYTTELSLEKLLVYL